VRLLLGGEPLLRLPSLFILLFIPVPCAVPPAIRQP
jgi:hypothetical protein